MRLLLYIVTIFSTSRAQSFSAIPDEADYRSLYPIVHIGVRVYEKFSSHTLSYFLGSLETWRYPKDRMHVSFFVDSSAEKMTSELKRWSTELSPKFYLSSTVVDVDYDNWREISLMDARRRRSAFSLITDTNCFFLPDSLRFLAKLLRDFKDKRALAPAVLSPLLNAPFGSYSNLYNLMTEDYVLRSELGTRQTYYVNEPMLLYLNHKDSPYLTFDEENIRTYRGRGTPNDVLAFSAFSMDIPITVDNTNFYGYLFQAGDRLTPVQHRRMFNTFLANLILANAAHVHLMHSTVVFPQLLKPTKFGFDAIFLINLVRRPERFRKMTAILDVLGIDFEVIPAVDGLQLTEVQMSQIKFLPQYEDPFYHRPMKLGEIGCFLSHLGIWRRMISEDLDKVIILEDDARFTENGLNILADLTEDLIKSRLDWEFIYLGRKKMNKGEEFIVPGHRYLSTVGYSYWTVGYAITKKGAQKLLDAQPLQKLMALDEVLPILYGQHPNKQWAEAYAVPENAILKAFSSYPLVIEPQHYTNQPEYISDTEDSPVIENVTSALEGDKSSSLILNPLSNIYSEKKLEL